jgi:LysR family hydrogen peroxide-inducible transcriptional activator
MIHKLEEELGVKIFDRSKQPVMPTEVGRDIVAQAQKILQETELLRQIVRDQRENLTGELRLGIIPTLAPYLLPLFLKSFSEKYSEVKLFVSELTTQSLITKLKRDQIDVGIMATPSLDAQLFEDRLFLEEFVVYAPNESVLLEKRFLLAEDIDPSHLVLLEEGHCVRSQVVNLCALQRAESKLKNIQYEASSLDTLRRLVEVSEGITILPELALQDFDEIQMQWVRFFRPPAPMREVSLVRHRTLNKIRLVEALKNEIIEHLPPFLREKKVGKVMPIG